MNRRGFYEKEETQIVVALPAGLALIILVMSVFEEVV